MPQITPNDPKRATEHDFVVLDMGAFIKGHRSKPKVVAAFDNQAEAMLFVAGTVNPGAVWVIDILHPDGCGCNPTEEPGTRSGIDN